MTNLLDKLLALFGLMRVSKWLDQMIQQAENFNSLIDENNKLREAIIKLEDMPY